MVGLTFQSLASGIEAATVAWAPLGWRALMYSEIDRFPSAVLAHHYPHTPNRGDMRDFRRWPLERADLVIAGTPCQSFSVAGLREGLADPRGNLALVYLAHVERVRPRWVVWENVPGVLSSNGGRDFGAFVGALGQLGYGWAYRCLDAQYYGLAQRRARVFVVGCLGDWRRAAAVLFEPASMRGDPAPRRTSGQEVAATVAASAGHHGRSSPRGDGSDNLIAGALTTGANDGAGWRAGADEAAANHVIALPMAFGGNNTQGPIDVATCRNAHGSAHGRHDFATETFLTFDTTQITSPTNRNNPQIGAPCHTLSARAHASSIAFNARQDPDISGDVSHPLGAKDTGHGMLTPGLQLIRRLTPRECERLQGFPDVRDVLRITICADERIAIAPSAERSSILQRLESSRPVAVHALIDSERQEVRLLSLGRLLWSASNAGGENSSPLRIPCADFARLAAGMLPMLERPMPAGRVELLQSTSGSTAPSSGSAHVLLSGREIRELASDADRLAEEMRRFITLEAGQDSQPSDLRLRTLSCCVAVATSGCIPAGMRSAPFYDILLEVVTPYTLIAYRGKPAGDGNRYRAIGNSIAVPVLRWIASASPRSTRRSVGGGS